MTVPRETLPTDFGVSRETLDRLQAFVTLLIAWNERINLVSKGDVDHVWQRHVVDSLQVLDAMPKQPSSAIDLGTGGGFPGLVLAIARDVPYTLIEADARKSAFLREAIRLTGAPASVLTARIESCAATPANLVTARALAPLSKLLCLAAPLLAPGGTMLFLKGASVEMEIAEASRTWTMRIERHISRSSAQGVILRISEVRLA